MTNSGIATYEATAGTYTFYALDSKGNETVKIVKITESHNGRNKGGWQSGIPGKNQEMQNPFDIGFGTAPNTNFGGAFNHSKQHR